MDSHWHCDSGDWRLIGFYRHERGEFSAALLSHTANPLNGFTKKVKIMKHKIQFEKETRVAAPEQKAILVKIQLLSGNWQSLRSLALAEPVKPCHRHVD